MIEVKVYKSVEATMNIVRELRASGLAQGLDFDFAYHKTKYTQDSWECLEPEHTIFMFHKEKYATLFSLKYST